MHEVAHVDVAGSQAGPGPDWSAQRKTPLAAITDEIARRLLATALSRGGDAADLFFEYSDNASYAFEDEKVKTTSRGVTLGLGVRVLKGEATGYAYTEELSDEAMQHAARTAAQRRSEAMSGGSVFTRPAIPSARRQWQCARRCRHCAARRSRSRSP